MRQDFAVPTRLHTAPELFRFGIQCSHGIAKASFRAVRHHILGALRFGSTYSKGPNFRVVSEGQHPVHKTQRHAQSFANLAGQGLDLRLRYGLWPRRQQVSLPKTPCTQSYPMKPKPQREELLESLLELRSRSPTPPKVELQSRSPRRSSSMQLAEILCAQGRSLADLGGFRVLGRLWPRVPVWRARVGRVQCSGISHRTPAPPCRTPVWALGFRICDLAWRSVGLQAHQWPQYMFYSIRL